MTPPRGCSTINTTEARQSREKGWYKMERTAYKGYIIDTDNLGRPYIYNTASPYSEDSDRITVYAETLDQCKAIVDARIQYGADIRRYDEIG